MSGVIWFICIETCQLYAIFDKPVDDSVNTHAEFNKVVIITHNFRYIHSFIFSLVA